jgi:hypothetical protein
MGLFNLSLPTCGKKVYKVLKAQPTAVVLDAMLLYLI